MRTRTGCPLLAILIALAVVAGIALTSPWAFHIGGRWTPFYWSGWGQLHTGSGTYPLFVTFYPARHFSRLHLDGLRPTGGLQGTGSLCTGAGQTQRLRLTGTIYGGWWSTENALLQFRLLEFQVLQSPTGRGYFDLYGRWSGQDLVMDDRGEPGRPFTSGLRLPRASATLAWDSQSAFEAACRSTPALPLHR